jgi:hypothetical protein
MHRGVHQPVQARRRGGGRDTPTHPFVYPREYGSGVEAGLSPAHPLLVPGRPSIPADLTHPHAPHSGSRPLTQARLKHGGGDTRAHPYPSLRPSYIPRSTAQAWRLGYPCPPPCRTRWSHDSCGSARTRVVSRARRAARQPTLPPPCRVRGPARMRFCPRRWERPIFQRKIPRAGVDAATVGTPCPWRFSLSASREPSRGRRQAADLVDTGALARPRNART